MARRVKGEKRVSFMGLDIRIKKKRKRKVSFMGLKVRKRRQAKTLTRTSRIIL